MIGLAVCYKKHNYGSMLQAYATQKVLDKIKVENEIINDSKLEAEVNKRKYLYFIKKSITSDFFTQKKGMLLKKIKSKIGCREFACSLKDREAAFEKFQKNNFRVSKEFQSFNDLTAYCKENYKAVVVGSDQLWLPGNIIGDYYTLNFVPDSVGKISYATSFGQSNLPNDCIQKATEFIDRIDYISVREETGKKIINGLTGRDVPVVCDPAMLLTADDWMNIQKNEPLIREKYIFCYFLGNNPKQRIWVKKLRELTGIKIIGLLHLDEYIKSDEDYVDYSLYDVGPAEFINLIRNSSFVCTDSFHCSLFSILYHKNFFTFRRHTENNNQGTNSRLDTLFSETGVNRTILIGDEDVEMVKTTDIDYESVDKKVHEYRNKSLKILMNFLREEGVECVVEE